MNFNSPEFLIFLPLVLILYWLVPHKFRYIVLLLASYYFYMSWNVWLIFLIVATTLVSYASGLLIERVQKTWQKKLLLILTIVTCIGALIFFKYFNFLVGSVIDFLNLFALKLDSFSLNIILPIGISFYTFQTLSYVIDVYRGKFSAEKHLGYYALFVCYFPQLVAGPIERPKDLIPQLKANHTFNFDDFICGMRIMLVGFFYKCVVADYVGMFVNRVFANVSEANALSVLLAGWLFGVQVFCDFAGYSEIATGTARMMGVKLTRNFNRPYIALSLSEFFRRWHVTLTRWLTDYVYIPLGGSRRGKARQVFNSFVVFFLCGLWHGANWTYVVWGLYAWLYMAVETLISVPLKKLLDKKGIRSDNGVIVAIKRTILILSFAISSLIFRSASVAQIGELLAKLFTTWPQAFATFSATLVGMGITPLAFVQIVLSILLVGKLWHFAEVGRESEDVLPLDQSAEAVKSRRMLVMVYIVLAIMLCWIALLSSGDISAFQYFQF